MEPYALILKYIKYNPFREQKAVVIVSLHDRRSLPPCHGGLLESITASAAGFRKEKFFCL